MMNERMKRFLIPGLLGLACLSFCTGAEADTTTVNNEIELSDAVKNPASLDIRLGGDILITASIPVSLDVKLDGAGKKLTVNGAFRHFNVTDTPTLEFKNVAFDGDAKGGGISIPSGGKAKFEGDGQRRGRQRHRNWQGNVHRGDHIHQKHGDGQRRGHLLGRGGRGVSVKRQLREQQGREWRRGGPE